MAFTNYATLKLAVADYLNRTDLTAVIPDFVTLFEVRARRDLHDWLRTTIALTNLTADTVLAASVGEVLSVSQDDGVSGANNFPLRLVSHDEYKHWMTGNSGAGSPAQICYPDVDVDAGTITLRFWPPASTTGPIANLQVEIVKILPSLSDAATTNALLTTAPDVYLFGSLAESAPYLQHDDRIPVWEGRMSEGMRALRMQSERRLYGGTPRPRPLDRVFG